MFDRSLEPRLRRVRRRPRSRGQSLVEFALILPAFILLFGTVLDLGRLAAARVAVTNAAREGAFQAAKTPTSFVANQPCPSAGTDGKPATNKITCRTLLESKGSVVTIAPSDVAVTCSTAGCPTGMGSTVTVDVTGHFQLLTPLLASFFGGTTNVTFKASSTTQIETLPPPDSSPLPSPSPSNSPSPSPTASPSLPPGCGLPSAGFTHNESPSNMKAPVTITVTDTSTSPPACPITTWVWHFGDGTIVSGSSSTAPPHTYIVAGTYQVNLTVSSAGGSDTTGAVTIKVK
ncbi:MAG TPA: PKD domain-containing protein [Candidatus Limnocylindrales bacterium]